MKFHLQLKHYRRKCKNTAEMIKYAKDMSAMW